MTAIATEHYARQQTTPAATTTIELSSLDSPLDSSSQIQAQAQAHIPLARQDSMTITPAPSFLPSSSTPSSSTPSSSSSTHHDITTTTTTKENTKEKKQDSQAGHTQPPKTALHAFVRRYPWLVGWNHEDWWPCWIGLFLFALVSTAVRFNIPAAHFYPWTSNPFDAFKSIGNLDLLILLPLQGLLVFLALWAVDAKDWNQFYKGFLVIESLSLLSKWLASQKNVKSASLGDSIWAILFGAMLRNAMAGAPLPDGRSKPLPAWLKVAQQTELYIAISLVLL
ncbi:hypothetical protein BG015_002339, partial [Linnemannia schmuckeri]